LTASEEVHTPPAQKNVGGAVPRQLVETDGDGVGGGGGGGGGGGEEDGFKAGVCDGDGEGDGGEGEDDIVGDDIGEEATEVGEEVGEEIGDNEGGERTTIADLSIVTLYPIALYITGTVRFTSLFEHRYSIDPNSVP